MRQVGHLSELHDKYFARGLRVIAISPEPPGLLESKVVEDLKATFWIASDPDRSTQSRFLSGGGGGIPHAYLVDARGTVIADMHPASLAEQAIEELLDGVFDPALGRELHPALRGAVRSYEKAQVGKAWQAAGRLVEDEDGAIAADAAYLRTRAEAWAGFRKTLVEDAIQARDYATAFDDLSAIAKDFAGMEVAGWAGQTRKALEGDTAVKAELQAWQQWRKASEREAEAGGRERKLAAVRVAYQRIVKRYPGTRGAELAKKALDRIGE